MTPQREITIVLGQTGSGKTHWAREYIKRFPRVLVADAGFGEFEIPAVDSYGGLLDYLEERKAFDTHRPFRVSYDFRPEEFGAAFECPIKLGDTLAVYEEADRFSEIIKDDSGAVVYAGTADPFYREAIYRGRHYGLSMLLLSLSPRAIPTEVRRQTTRIVSFRQIFPADVEWLRDVIGDEADKLPTLPGPPQKPPHPYLLWTQKDGVKIVAQ